MVVKYIAVAIMFFSFKIAQAQTATDTINSLLNNFSDIQINKDGQVNYTNSGSNAWNRATWVDPKDQNKYIKFTRKNQKHYPDSKIIFRYSSGKLVEAFGYGGSTDPKFGYKDQYFHLGLTDGQIDRLTGCETAGACYSTDLALCNGILQSLHASSWVDAQNKIWNSQKVTVSKEALAGSEKESDAAKKRLMELGIYQAFVDATSGWLIHGVTSIPRKNYTPYLDLCQKLDLKKAKELQDQKNKEIQQTKSII